MTFFAAGIASSILTSFIDGVGASPSQSRRSCSDSVFPFFKFYPQLGNSQGVDLSV